MIEEKPTKEFKYFFIRGNRTLDIQVNTEDKLDDSHVTFKSEDAPSEAVMR